MKKFQFIIIICVLLFLTIRSSPSFGSESVDCINIFSKNENNVSSKSKIITQVKNAINTFYIRNKLTSLKINEFETNLKKLENTSNDSDFYWSLAFFVNQLGNYHTFFVPFNHFNSFGFQYHVIDGKNLITKIHPKLSEKLKIGDEILTLNGSPCLLGHFKYLRKVSGDFKFKRSNGEIFFETLESELFLDETSLEITVKDNYAHIKIPNFREQKLGDVIFEQVNKSKNKKIIIFDLRGNSGGLISEMLSVIQYFASGEMGYLSGILGKKYLKVPDTENLRNKVGKVFVITDPESFSAAEIFTHLLKTRVNAQVIGQTTKGGLESVVSVTMPDKSILSIANAEYCDMGVCFYGKKIEPDILLPLGTPIEEIISVILKQP